MKKTKQASKKGKSKSNSSALNINERSGLHKLYGLARQLKQTRCVLPHLLRAKLQSIPTLKAQRLRWDMANIAMGEALCSALTFNSLKDYEKATLLRMLQGLVTSVAERSIEFVTPSVRSKTETILGCTLEKHLQDNALPFKLDVANTSMDPHFKKTLMERLKDARSTIDVLRIGAETRRLFDPQCAGDIEYFADRMQHEKIELHRVEHAIKVLDHFMEHLTESNKSSANLISFATATKSAANSTEKDSTDIVARLELLEKDPRVGGFDQIIELMPEAERNILRVGLEAYSQMLNSENQHILSHPDCDPIMEFVEGFTDLEQFDPTSHIAAMIERETFFRLAAYEIINNKSARKVREIIADFQAHTNGDDDEWFDSDDDDTTFFEDEAAYR